MDSSHINTQVQAQQLQTQTSLAAGQEAVEAQHEEEHHLHLPNPSIWPLILSVAVIAAVAGLFFLPDSPWLTIIAAPFVLVGIMGWALEDPNAPTKEHYIAMKTDPALANSRFQIGQEVVDRDGHHVGTLQARFGRYILVEQGGLAVKAFYVPISMTEETIRDTTVRLTVSEAELKAGSYNTLPDDLYNETPEFEVPQTTGVPMLANDPVSPAETGHYNYGPIYPGINTDASGSYRRDEVSPAPQQYVSDWKRRRSYAAQKINPAG